MRGALKHLHSPDVWDLKTYQPATDDFGVLIQVMAGPDDDDSSESFNLMVCTPGWLAKKLESSPILDGRHHLFVRTYDYGALERHIRERCASCEGPSWHEVAAQLARLGHWEFEDYNRDRR